MFRLTVIVNIFLLFNLTNGQIFELKDCGNQEPQAGFDLVRFLGQWYEAARYPSFSELPSVCIKNYFGLARDSKVTVSTNQISLIGKADGYNGTASYSAAYDGNFDVIFSNGPMKELSYSVIGTDYKNYAVLYSGSDFVGVGCFQSLWILTRDRNPSLEVLNNAEKVLEGRLIKLKLSTTIQSPCRN